MSLFRSLFGPSKNEIWQQFCAETGGTYTADSFWTTGKAEAMHGQWTVTLDTYAVSNGKSSTTYTRMRAPYVNPDGFMFAVYRKGIFSDLGKWMGMQDVTVGHPEFDEAFVIKGNDEQKLRRLFSNAKSGNCLVSNLRSIFPCGAMGKISGREAVFPTASMSFTSRSSA